MPIITAVEAKSRWVKFVYFMIYLVLTLGAITMVYPMMLMISGSMKSEADVVDMSPIPKFLFDDEVLYQKYLEHKFTGQIKLYQQALNQSHQAWMLIPYPKDIKKDPKLIGLFKEFREKYSNPKWQVLGFCQTPYNLYFRNVRGFQKFLENHFGNISKLNDALNTGYNSILEVLPPTEADMPSRRFTPARTLFFELYTTYKMSRPAYERIFVDLDGYFRQNYIIPIYTTIENYNKLHNTNYGSFYEIFLAENPPVNPKEREDWEKYVREELNIWYIRLDRSEEKNYRNFLQQKYKTIESLNKIYNTNYSSFEEIPFSENAPITTAAAADWTEFIKKHAKLESISVYGPRQAFEGFLKEKGYEFGNDHAILAKARMMTFLDEFESHKKAFKWECIKENYQTVLDYILLHGRGVYNTIVYCLLLILAQLIVNPLAAYAMSRYKLPSTYKILLFCMATMAFPPAVTMIPTFLLLRKFNLLNTFAALILPSMANGYWIFLLKGFFDSLPQELYEAADIDGANEWTKFWVITMSLSKPVLAVIALQAFTLAYSNFMAALIIIPDQKMWTLMIWLYQLQTYSHRGIVYAALCLAGIPTLLVFLFAQNVIMRGIVVPVEK